MRALRVARGGPLWTPWTIRSQLSVAREDVCLSYHVICPLLWMLGLWGCGQRGALSTNPSGRSRRAELGGPRGINRFSLRAEPSQAARAVEDGELAVGVLMHPHGSFDVVMAMALRRYLQADHVHRNTHAGRMGPEPVIIR